MSGMDLNEKAGAAPTATGLDDAKAYDPAFPNSANDGEPPEGEPSDADGIDGADLLNRVHDYARRFICYPSDTAGIVHVLWIAHAHLMDAWFSTPRLAVLSPEPGSGKSRVLEITALLVPSPALSVNSSAAYILRKVADQDNRPTILYDEIDTIFGPAARGNEDLRGMINAGYRRGAKVGRCFTEKGKVLTQDFSTYAAIAMGGLGDLPDTIMSRSVIMRMRRRGQGEKVEPFTPRLHEPPANILRDELVAWAASVFSLAETFQPILPDGISDRNAEVWEPLLMVAELAGGQWPDLARQAATEAVQSAKANNKPSLGVQLLADIRACFSDKDRLTTADLLNKLLADEEAPWGDLGRKKLDARILAKMLGEHGIKSSTIRMPNDSTPKGYKREAFHDAWKRYLPPLEIGATSATDATNQESPDKTEASRVADKTALPPCGGTAEGVAEPES
ncbi:DUF3631 domain-containing protein [Allorhizobium undicola]|uniref:DUF3631 domain-containing protein n=1 Tax=Allorhizobium undicola TaxID=78527 RepID=UPI003D345F85